MSKSKHKRISKFTRKSLANMTPEQLRDYYSKFIKITPLTMLDHLLVANFEGLEQYLAKQAK